MGVLGYPKTGVLEVENSRGGVFEDGSWETSRAGAEVGYLLTGGHFEKIEYILFFRE